MAADMTVDTRLNTQLVSLALNLVGNGQPYISRCNLTTTSAGWGNKYLAELPIYLDDCARQLSERLRAAKA